MGDGVKINPEGYDDIVKKYHEQDQRGTQEALKRRGVKDEDELREASRKALAAQIQRQPRTTLKSHEVIVNPETKGIGEMRAKLDQEIKGVFQKATTPQEPSKTLREHNITQIGRAHV